jgi:hypothetical protein
MKSDNPFRASFNKAGYAGGQWVAVAHAERFIAQSCTPRVLLKASSFSLS